MDDCSLIRVRTGFASLALATVACAGGDGTRDTIGESPARDSVRVPYIGGAVPAAGSISGSVEWRATPPPAGAPPATCPPVRRRRSTPQAVVWIADIRAGKPRALDRRAELVARECGLEPLTQYAVAGGTLNVRNADTTSHRLRFIEEPSGRVLREVALLPGDMVVPVRDVVARPRRVRVTCGNHAAERAWLLVFDHPYVAWTDDREFRFDSVPAGRWRLVAWEALHGTISDSVVVEAGDRAKVTLRFE